MGVESIIKLISAEAEAEALLCLAELGKSEVKVEVKTKKKIEIEEVEDCTSGAVSLVNNKNLLHRKVDPHPHPCLRSQTDSGGPHGPPWEQIRFGSRSILHSETSLCDVDPPKGGTWLKKLA